MFAVMDQNCPVCAGKGIMRRDGEREVCPQCQEAFDRYVYQMLLRIREELNCVSDATEDQYARGHLTTAYVMVVNLQHMFKPLERPEIPF